jgi:Ligand-gated ion channel
VLGTLTSQGEWIRSKNKSRTILAITWGLACFVLLSSYSSTLTGYLSAQYKAPEVNSLKQLAESPEYQLILRKGSIAELHILVTDFI